MTWLRNISIQDGVDKDAFGRLRVDQLVQLLNYSQEDDNQSFITDEEINGTGAAVHSTNDSGTTLSTAADADFAIRQTLERFGYQTGQSYLAKLTLVNMAAETNVAKRAGIFTSTTVSPFNSGRDGFWFESSASDLHFKIANNGTETTVSRASWLDPFDGTGLSGKTIDFTQIIHFWVDYQWVGRVRFGFIVDGEKMVAYEHNSAGLVPTSRSPTHPVRWEIHQSGAGGGSFIQVSASLHSEGAPILERSTFSGSIGVTPVGSLNTGTKYAIGGLRLKSSKLNGAPRLQFVTMISTTNSNVQWEITRNPVVAGTFTYNDTGGSLAVAIAVDNTNTVTGGVVIAAGMFAGNTVEPIRLEDYGKFPFGVQIDGTPVETVMVVEPFANNAAITGTVTWAENF